MLLNIIKNRGLLLLPLFIILCSLFIGSCDLFQPRNPGYFEELQDEVVWANAAKLNVTMVYPQEWGSGADRFFDNVRTNESPRKGYPFTVQFDPAAAFGDAQWRAYRTADLPPHASNWFVSTANTRTELAKLDEKMLSPDEVNFSTPRGSSSTVTINISDDITIIPWSYMQPRITHSSPPVTATYESFSRNANRDILITFASSVVKSTLVFEPGYIEITSDGEDVTEKYFISPPAYDDETLTLTIQSKGNIPEGINIEVKLGTEIKSEGDLLKGMNEPVIFSWRTTLADDSISGLEAFYNEKDNQIEMKWNLPAGTEIYPRVRYRINNDNIQTINSLDSTTSHNITYISAPDYGSIREGRAITGINSYTIFVYLGEDIKTIKIWNIPNMKVSDTEPLIELNHATGLSIPNEATGQYVLTSAITINKHTPIVNFTGKLYGNGYTITINSMNTAADMGLFGVVGNNAIVRDLTVLYDNGNPSPDNAVSVSPNSNGSFGGIAGTVSGIPTEGGARFENVLVKGAVTVAGSGGEVRAGGLVGRITSTATNPRVTIINAYGGLDLTVNRAGFIGGAVGIIGTSRNDGAAALLEQITVAGDITIGTSNNRVSGALYAGGLAGSVRGGVGLGASLAVFDDVEYKDGTITVYALGTGVAKYIGGGIGRINGYADIQNCSTVAGGLNIDKYTSAMSGAFYVGGFSGDIQRPDGVINNIINCYSENLVVVNFNGEASSFGIAGFAGRINADITYCYAKGDVSVSASRGIYAAGFVGEHYGGNISFCYATGNVSLTAQGEHFIAAGGFAGYALNSSGPGGSVSHSYALGDVFVHSSGTAGIDAGGFSGSCVNRSVVENCFAFGTVIVHRSVASGSTRAGGFTGRLSIAGSTIRNCVVAVLPRNVNTGMSITATGLGEKNVGRIYGDISNTVLPLPSNNYAWNGIRLFRDDAYDTGNPTPDTSMTALTRVRGGKDGEDVGSGVLRTRSFWEDRFFTETVYTTINGVEKYYPAWNFVGIEGRGYPRLRTADGGLLGGQ